MSDGSEWAGMKAASKSKFDADRKRFLVDAVTSDDGRWLKHTEYHWSRDVAGKRLDYWPSRKKYQYNGHIRRGDVMKFISRAESNR